MMEKEKVSDIKKSMKAMLNVHEDDVILYQFALEEFYKSGKSKPGLVWFNGYEVVDENTLRINYQYGGGDLEMDASFDIEIK